MSPTSSRAERLAAVYDAEVWPLVPARAADMLVAALWRDPPQGAYQVVELGCATGAVTMALAAALGEGGRIAAFDSAAALVDIARARAAESEAAARASFEVAEADPPNTLGETTFDLAVSNLAVTDSSDPPAAIAALARAVKPGGRVAVTLQLRGTWAEFIDLYRDVLLGQGRADALAALATYEAKMPDVETVVQWMEAAGLRDVAIETSRTELLFGGAREFFFSPVIELGPLSQWKQISGGRGDEMQDAFFFVKEAIDTYFSGAVFPVTVVLGCATGTRPNAPRARGPRKSNGRKAST